VAFGVDVANRLLADVSPGEAADDFLGPGPEYASTDTRVRSRKSSFARIVSTSVGRKMCGSRARS
jgi:hypothetical protein